MNHLLWLECQLEEQFYIPEILSEYQHAVKFFCLVPESPGWLERAQVLYAHVQRVKNI